MGIVPKAYTVPLSDATGTINVSDILRALDDIYDELNGNVETVNIASTLTFNASNVLVTQTDNLYTGTTLEALATEVVQRGYNSVHVFANGVVPKLFPGIVEVDGVMCRLNAAVDLSGNTTLLSGGNPESSTVYAVVVNQALNLTASDFKLVPEINVSPTDFTISKNGIYYTDSASVERRAIGAVYCQSAGINFFPERLYQKPNRGFTIHLTSTQYLGLSFSSASDLDGVYQAVRGNFDFNTLYYGFDMKIRVTNTTSIVFGMDDSWYGSKTCWEFYLDQANMDSAGGIGQNFFRRYVRTGASSVYSEFIFLRSAAYVYSDFTSSIFLNFKRHPYHVRFY